MEMGGLAACKALASVLIMADAPQQITVKRLHNYYPSEAMVSVLVVGGASDSRASTRILADTTGTFEIYDVVPGVQPKEGYFRRGRSRRVAESSAEFALREAERD